MIRYIDAFSGLGGFSLGTKQILGKGAECVLAIDFNREVVATFEKNFSIPSYGNIREIAAQPDSVPDHDILFGGFPCQPFSRNGRWFNKNGRVVGDTEDRDNLFLELVKILVAKQPNYFLFENVAGIQFMKNKDGSPVLDTIIGNLKEAGYDVQHQVVDAANFGVPQQRRRVFFAGIHGRLGRSFQFPIPAKTTPVPAIEDVLEPSVPDRYLLEKIWSKRTILHHVRPTGKKANHPFPTGHSRYDAIKWIYEQNTKPTERTGKVESVAILYGDTPSGMPRQQDKIYSKLGLSPTVLTSSTPSVDAPEGFRWLTPRECARLQGFPDWYQLPELDSTAYHQVGNAVCVPVVAALVQNLVVGQKAQTQTCVG